MMSIENLKTLIGLLIGLFSFLSGAALWYKGSIEKKYAAERDFAHLRRNQEQIASGIVAVNDEIDERFHAMNLELVQIKALLMAVLAKSGDGTSGIIK